MKVHFHVFSRVLPEGRLGPRPRVAPPPSAYTNDPNVRRECAGTYGEPVTVYLVK